MHSVDIAKEITANEFYIKNDGSFVDWKQVRLCTNNNSDIFVCLPNNIIKLKTDWDHKEKTIYKYSLWMQI